MTPREIDHRSATAWSWHTSGWSRRWRIAWRSGCHRRSRSRISISVGVLGLIDAASRYRAVARRAVRRLCAPPRPGRDARRAARAGLGAPFAAPKLRRELDLAMARCAIELRREPTEEEIAATLNMTAARLRTLARAAPHAGARRRPPARRRDRGQDAGLLDLCFDPDEGPEMRLQRTELREHLARAIEQLPRREEHSSGDLLPAGDDARRDRARSSASANRACRSSLAGHLASAHHAARVARSGGEGGVDGKILSQDEIDALLGLAVERRPPAPGRRGGHELSSPTTSAGRIAHPAEQIRSLHFLHDRFARNCRHSLSAYLRTVTEVEHRFGGAVPVLGVPDVAAGPDRVLRDDAAADGGLGGTRAESVGRVHDDRPVCGGSGSGLHGPRASREIEQNVVDAVVKLMLERPERNMAAIVPVRFQIKARETRPQMLQWPRRTKR